MNDQPRYIHPDLKDGKITIGSIVVVEEKIAPWVEGRWEGKIVNIPSYGDPYVQPLPGQSLIKKVPFDSNDPRGVILAPEDKITLKSERQTCSCEMQTLMQRGCQCGNKD